MTNMAQFKTKGHQYEYLWIMPEKLNYDPLYQREVSQSVIARILREWNYDLINEPKVSKRADGTYWVFNGQHTIAAWIKHEGANAPILCKVFRGLTWEEEKDLFVAQNGISTDPTTAEKLRAEYNDPNSKADVRGMVECCARVGVKVAFEKSKKSAYACNAVAALYGAYRSLPREKFERMMGVICKAWAGEQASLQAGFIKGMKYIYQRFDLRDSEMVKSLSKYAPEFYVRESKELGGALETRFAHVMLKVYNNKRTTKRIAVVGG